MENHEDKKTARLMRWEKYKRLWYHLYLFLGVGINFILYFTKPYGFDPSGSLLWGAFFGFAIPVSTMLVCAYIHEKILTLL